MTFTAPAPASDYRESGLVFPPGFIFGSRRGRGGSVHDTERVDYLRRHFTAAHRAIARGVDLRGYFVWSLLDKFEWGYGFAKRFGIVHVDFDSLQRTVKDSGLWFGRFARTGVLPE